MIGFLSHRSRHFGPRVGGRQMPLLVFLCAMLGSTGVLAGTPYSFDQSGYLGEAALLPDWADTMRRQRAQAPVLDACLAAEDACPRHYRGLRELLLRAADLPAAKQLHLVNHYVNRKRYHQDIAGRLVTPLSDEAVRYRSRWSTVEEFMRRGGDCEDYATTKYYLLRRLGFATEQLRVVVTWDRLARGYHALLAVRIDGKVLLLESDNTIRYAGRHAYLFIYSVNESSIWDHEASASRSRDSQPTKEKSA